MPLYYFDVDDGDGPSMDDEGLDFPDQATGEREAVKLLAEIAAEVVGLDNDRISVRLRIEGGAIVFSARLVVSSERHRPRAA